MKKNFLLITLLIAIFALPAFAKPTRIKFKRGATSTTVNGTMSSYNSKRVYVIRVRDSQTLTVQDIGKHAVSIYIQGPPGSVEQDLAADCHGQSELPTTKGDYTITVEECKKVDEWKGSFKFKITVK